MMECNVPVSTELWEARGQEIQVLRGQEIQTQIGSWAVVSPNDFHPIFWCALGIEDWRPKILQAGPFLGWRTCLREWRDGILPVCVTEAE